MTWVKRTFIVPEANVSLARRLCSELAGPAGRRMFEAELSVTGTTPATHYADNGLIQDNFANLLTDAQMTYYMCQQMVSLKDVILVQIQALYAAAVIVADADPHKIIADAGLKKISRPLAV
jgi:hypothetical protein